jgi:DNA primase
VQQERARCLTAILLRHPNLVHDVEEAWCGLEVSLPLSRLRDAMLHIEDVSALDSERLVAHLNASGLADDVALVLSASMPLPPSARAGAMPAEAEGEWWHLFGLMRGLPHMNREIAQAEQEYRETETDAAARRLAGLALARLELTNIDPDAE